MPRYTSYPTAPHFSEAVGASAFRRWLGALPAGSRLSLYVHIPFCDTLCWFCGCQTSQIRRYAPLKPYLSAIACELREAAGLIGSAVEVSQIHWGGGSPTILVPDDIDWLAAQIRRHLTVAPDAEFCVEIDPRGFDAPRAAALARSGLTRASIGVQDFSPRVQAAINRVQSFEETRTATDMLRQLGIGSLNLDLMYGLPHQTCDDLAATVDKAVALSPDRVALFGYAHVPWMKAHQRLIPADALPDAPARLAQMALASQRLAEAGYRAIGIDHFALPDDPLARAAERGRLRRNFQGYTTDNAGALIGIGASAISRLPQGYVQNERATGRYIAAIEANGLAAKRGIALTPDDRLRGYVIERLLCDFRLSFGELEGRFGDAARPVIAEACGHVAVDPDGLIEVADDHFIITDRGRPFARSIAARFDACLVCGEGRHSIAV